MSSWEHHLRNHIPIINIFILNFGLGSFIPYKSLKVTHSQDLILSSFQIDPRHLQLITAMMEMVLVHSKHSKKFR